MTNWLATGVEPQRGRYSFRVKEAADGTPWIAAEPAGDTIKIVGSKGGDLQIGFFLRPGATIDDAQKVAEAMNRWIAETILYDLPAD